MDPSEPASAVLERDGAAVGEECLGCYNRSHVAAAKTSSAGMGPRLVRAAYTAAVAECLGYCSQIRVAAVKQSV